MERSQPRLGVVIGFKAIWLLIGLFYAWAMTRTHRVDLAVVEFCLSVYLLSLVAGRDPKFLLLPRLSLRFWFLLLTVPLIWLGYQVNLARQGLVWIEAESEFVESVQRLNGRIQTRSVRNYWKSRGIAPWVGSLFVENVEAVTSVNFLMDAPITDADLQSLNLDRHPTLERVSVAQHPITDQGIAAICDLPNLQQLNLM